MNHPNYEIRASAISGQGLFATRSIAAGEMIDRLQGERLGSAEILSRISGGMLNKDEPLQIEADAYLVLNSVHRLFNHHCHPSAGIRNQSDLIALRAVNAGDEITFDYSTTVSSAISDEYWHMPCACSYPYCRKYIRNFLSIPLGTFLSYFSADALPRFIQLEWAKACAVNSR